MAAKEADRKILEKELWKFAKEEKEKYIEPPYTTNFAISFLPFEGLYGAVLHIPNLFLRPRTNFM